MSVDAYFLVDLSMYLKFTSNTFYQIWNCIMIQSLKMVINQILPMEYQYSTEKVLDDCTFYWHGMLYKVKNMCSQLIIQNNSFKKSTYKNFPFEEWERSSIAIVKTFSSSFFSCCWILRLSMIQLEFLKYCHWYKKNV